MNTKNFKRIIGGQFDATIAMLEECVRNCPPCITIAVMQGAATLNEHRGQGIYTAMMAKRLADARAMGKDTAVLQGDRKTSAPICVKLGFKDVCSIDYYLWGNA